MATKSEVNRLLEQASEAMSEAQLALNLFHLYLRNGRFESAEKAESMLAPHSRRILI